jgi:hypothetical protein
LKPRAAGLGDRTTHKTAGELGDFQSRKFTGNILKNMNVVEAGAF